MMSAMSPTEMERDREKASVAAASAIAAVGLTAFKAIVGMMTGSLGILAEAAHSGLDLVAALVTYFAVRVSSRPPDLDHTYGHGKVENLSALIETGLLLATCAWIVYEAAHRLRYGSAEIDPSPWAFIVMGASIVIDFGRSRSLSRAAKKYRSQALEADALHFSTDIWSSFVVIFGLGCVWTSQRYPSLKGLKNADSVAALGVSAIVIYVSWQLGRRTIDALLDRVPPGLSLDVQRAAGGVPGVTRVTRIRVREVGGRHFVEIGVDLDRKKAFERAGEISGEITREIQKLLPEADVIVHADPVTTTVESEIEKVQICAARLEQKVHNVVVFEASGKKHVNYHLEVPESVLLRDAWVIAERLEACVRSELSDTESVTVHFDPRSAEVARLDPGDVDLRAAVQKVRDVLLSHAEILSVHDLVVQRAGVRHKDGTDATDISCHCTFSPDMPVSRIHELDDLLQEELRGLIPGLRYLFLQPEPPWAGGGASGGRPRDGG